ncbi:MAG TPA: restriction endonuclease [Candidatus Gallibacteroides avistercoris]|uniref:Restriction endonuclease n=1 Tax=Candidatus Gallibacteroides avistercoris TaxID=2840833 RepID=A0A9D1M809_9BACT|nr:restriction endonuclease [Candidatus Gallibacteroides avistercoris]
MNEWLHRSIEYANKQNYLDDLFNVYPIIPSGKRKINPYIWKEVELAFKAKNNTALVSALLKLELFPIKDSFIAYLKHDKKALNRNPELLKRICDQLYELSLDEIFVRCSAPKETNRQIGPMFKKWVNSGALGLTPVPLNLFTYNTEDAILHASDKAMKAFAQTYLGYKRKKGLDFLARINGRYIIGETKFLTETGGHQNAQFEDAITTLTLPGVQAIQIAILDGVLYIPSDSKMYKAITNEYQEHNIMSALLLKDFLHAL